MCTCARVTSSCEQRSPIRAPDKFDVRGRFFFCERAFIAVINDPGPNWSSKSARLESERAQRHLSRAAPAPRFARAGFAKLDRAAAHYGDRRPFEVINDIPKAISRTWRAAAQREAPADRPTMKRSIRARDGTSRYTLSLADASSARARALLLSPPDPSIISHLPRDRGTKTSRAHRPPAICSIRART